MKNIIEQFLDELEVPYTRRFVRRLYNGHPHRNNMFGLKRMLDVFGLRTIGVNVKNLNPESLTYPCILHIHGDFVIARNHRDGKLTYLHHGTETVSDMTEFGKLWTGNALVVDGTTEAVEPDLRGHRLEDIADGLKKCGLPLMLVVTALIGMAVNHSAIGLYGAINILLSVVGLAICIMLVQKQVFGASRYGDRVCSLLGHSDCSGVLDGPASGIMGVSWSEVGLGYFMADILTVALCPGAVPAVAVINWTAMAYGVWSILYQWRVRSWCVLCVSVQVTVWLTGGADVVWVTGNGLSLDAMTTFLTCMAFGACILLVHLLTYSRASEEERMRLTQRYRSLKANAKVANALLEAADHHDVTLDDSSIVFGRRDSPVRVTVLTNPHCNPCARMHRKVEELLAMNEPGICVQYILTSFGSEFDDSSRYLISCFLENDEHEAHRLFSRWYAGDRKIPVQFRERLLDEAIGEEMERHRRWHVRTRISSTPTVLVNGHVLPGEYEILDLPMIAGLNVLNNITHDIGSRSTTLPGAERPSAEEAVSIR